MRYYFYSKCLMLLSFVLASCETALTKLEEERVAAPASKEVSHLALDVDYDVETVTTSKPAEGVDVTSLTVFDRIGMEPKVTREQVSFKIFVDGRAEMVIQKKTPTDPLVIEHDVPKDDSRQVVYSVLKNNTLTLYDASYQPIGDPMPAPLPDFKELVEQLKKGEEGDLTAKFSGGSNAVLGKTHKVQGKPKDPDIVLKERKELPDGKVKIVTESPKRDSCRLL